jgi:hypothetical protein
MAVRLGRCSFVQSNGPVRHFTKRTTIETEGICEYDGEPITGTARFA